MSASDLFCSEDDWARKILHTHEWPEQGEDPTVFAVPSIENSIGITVGDAESPVVFSGFKVDPITGGVALSVCLGSKWAPVAHKIYEKFSEKARQRCPSAPSKLLSFPSPLIDAEYADLILFDVRQPLRLTNDKGHAIEWTDLTAGDRVTATVHFGGFVSNGAVSQMALACSSMQKL